MMVTLIKDGVKLLCVARVIDVDRIDVVSRGQNQPAAKR
jgi:hypothetical protein